MHFNPRKRSLLHMKSHRSKSISKAFFICSWIKVDIWIFLSTEISNHKGEQKKRCSYVTIKRGKRCSYAQLIARAIFTVSFGQERTREKKSCQNSPNSKSLVAQPSQRTPNPPNVVVQPKYCGCPTSLTYVVTQPP